MIIPYRHPVFGFEGEVNVGHQNELLAFAVGRYRHIVAGFRFAELLEDGVVVEGLTRVDEVAELLQLGTVCDFNNVLVEVTDHQLHHLEGVAGNQVSDADTFRYCGFKRASVDIDAVAVHPFPLHAVAAAERIGIAAGRESVGTQLVGEQHRLGGGDTGIQGVQTFHARVHSVGSSPVAGAAQS